MTTISTIARFGLARWLVSAGLLAATVSPCVANGVSPSRGAAAVFRGDDSEKHNAAAPAAEVSAPETARPFTVIGLGWG